GQADVLRSMGRGTEAEVVAGHAQQLDAAPNGARLRLLEAQAAATYWAAWAHVPLTFARRDLPRIPAHWRTFGARSSPLASGPRNAATPGHALLNYLYAVLETEARIALVTVGLDPGLGLLHHDQPSRDSLALDLMEAVRPHVDAWLLQLLERQVFAYNDFFEQ